MMPTATPQDNTARITNDDEHMAALERVQSLMDSVDSGAWSEELNQLVDAVVAYEKVHYAW